MTSPDTPTAVLDHLDDDSDIIVGMANGEPTAVIDAIEAHSDRFNAVRLHQMYALHDRAYLGGGTSLQHVAYFLTSVSRPYFHRGTIDLVPNDFSDSAAVMRSQATDPLVVVASSLPDAEGYVSLGVSCDYVASFIGQARFFVEATREMPHTNGKNRIHLSQLAGWCRSDRPLADVAPRQPDEIDKTIAVHIAERIPDGATLQAGVGTIPNAVMELLTDHRDLGIHTELLSDNVVDLIESGAVTGARKTLNPGKIVATFALGTRRLHRFLDGNDEVEMWPVSSVNSLATIAGHDNFVSINATLSVDFLGQCASETIGGTYHSSSGGQTDFARGVIHSSGGQGFVALHSTTSQGASRIVPQLAAGEVATTPKNIVDKVVTEWGVAELRGRSIRERTRALIAIAHPDHRDRLRADANRLGYL